MVEVGRGRGPGAVRPFFFGAPAFIHGFRVSVVDLLKPKPSRLTVRLGCLIITLAYPHPLSAVTLFRARNVLWTLDEHCF